MDAALPRSLLRVLKQATSNEKPETQKGLEIRHWAKYWVI
jgi:hypothetical protein